MISKETFVKIIEAIKQERNKIYDLNSIFRKYGDKETELFNFSIENIVLDIFEDLFKDKYWISCWIYELDFGEIDSHVSEEINGIEKEYDISTAEKFYDFLIENLHFAV